MIINKVYIGGFPDSLVGKDSACNAGDMGSIPGLGRSSGEGIGYLLQHSAGEFHGLCSLWGCKESDMTERLSLSKCMCIYIYIYKIHTYMYNNIQRWNKRNPFYSAWWLHVHWGSFFTNNARLHPRQLVTAYLFSQIHSLKKHLGCTQLFIAALFIITPNWKLSMCLSVGSMGWTNTGTPMTWNTTEQKKKKKRSGLLMHATWMSPK